MKGRHKMITADFHVHSDFSSDGKAPMEEMVEQAIRLGLKKLCFTDHIDYDYPKQPEGYTYTFDPVKYTKKLEKLKTRYEGKLEILTGIELGLQPHLKERLTALTQSYPFDFFIGSSHVADHLDPYLPQYWEGTTVEDGIRRYFESILKNLKSFTDFCVYGHIDYIIRYIPGQAQAAEKISYSYRDYADILDEVLKTIIHLGKGIEINSSGLKYGLKYAHPQPEVLKRYKELGGEIITIGSDAHRPEHLAYDFDLIPDILKDAGFRYYTTFTQQKPVFEKL